MWVSANMCLCVSVNECVCREAALQVRTGRRPLQQREKRREEREAVTEEGWQERANRKTCCSFQIHFLLFSLSGAEDYLQHRDVKLWWTKSVCVCDCSQNWKPKTVSLKKGIKTTTFREHVHVSSVQTLSANCLSTIYSGWIRFRSIFCVLNDESDLVVV